jgi:hypothetical protein
MMPRSRQRLALQDDRQQRREILDDDRPQPDRMMQGLRMRKQNTPRQDTVDRALDFGRGDKPAFPPLAGPVEPGLPPHVGPEVVLPPTPLQTPREPAHAEQSATAGTEAIVPVEMPPTSAPAHAKVAASVLADVPVGHTAAKPVPVPSNLKEVTAVIWEAMEDKKAKAKLLAAETRKAKGEAAKAAKVVGEESDDMDETTPVIKTKTLAKSAMKTAKTPAAVPVKKTIGELSKKPAAASAKKGATYSITVAHEKSRSRFCVRVFTDGTPVATSFSYKSEAKAAVEKKLKAHLYAERRRYGIVSAS